jgi:hypothetical protein
MSLKNSTGSLLTGLPASDYLIAFGEVLDPAQMSTAIEDLDQLLTPAREELGIDVEKSKELHGLIEEIVTLARGVRGTIEALPAGADGLIGMSFIVDTTDSKRFLDLKAKIVERVLALARSAVENADEDEAKAKAILDAVEYKRAAETVNGAEVDQFKLDLTKIEDIDEEDTENLQKITGKDGVLVRMASVDPQHVVVAFGGGVSHLTKLIESVRKDAAPLDKDAGIAKVEAYLPSPRASVAYLAVDQLLVTINRAAVLLDEEKLPVQMPTLNAPLAMTSLGADAWAQFDIYLPNELVVASKDAIMVLTGQGPVPPGAPSSTPPPAP